MKWTALVLWHSCARVREQLHPFQDFATTLSSRRARPNRLIHVYVVAQNGIDLANRRVFI
jgi:hypothetical protein